MSVDILLLGIALLVTIGYAAEFLFKRLKVPDVLILIFIGFLIGPFGTGIIHPADIASMALPFTTFVLLFLLFDGAFSIDLRSFTSGLPTGVMITLFNFIISSLVISGILLVFRFDMFTSLFIGFALGGYSSAFAIPIIKQMRMGGNTRSAITLESAFTDVLCIVFALAVIDIIALEAFSIRNVLSSIMSIFAVATLMGLLAGIVWIVLYNKLLKGSKLYLLTIAYVILVYVLTETFSGNGAIAALMFGLVLKNSKQLTSIFSEIQHTNQVGVAVTTKEEQYFYDQISFLLKTFFFVYIGILVDFTNGWLLLIAAIISVALMFSRTLTGLITHGIEKEDRPIISAIFARGLAPAALVTMAASREVFSVDAIGSIGAIVYMVITFTIILSSLRIFWIMWGREDEKAPVDP